MECSIGKSEKAGRGKHIASKKAGLALSSLLLTDRAAAHVAEDRTVVDTDGVSYEMYTVRRGESLHDVLRKHSMSAGEIKRLNPVADIFALKEGDILRVRRDEEHYRMKEGDTLDSVAALAGLTTTELLKANGHLRPSEFTEGQCVILPEKP